MFRRILKTPTLPASALRYFSKERASKGVKPGTAIVLDGQPHMVQKITQGRRGKGGGFVRFCVAIYSVRFENCFRALVKSLTSSNTFEKTFTADEIGS